MTFWNSKITPERRVVAVVLRNWHGAHNPHAHCALAAAHCAQPPQAGVYEGHHIYHIGTS
jgi:hypothetical protein